MHEFSLMADLMRKIEALAAENNARRVVAVQVWLGALSHISPEHFREHFVNGSRGTIAEGSTVEVECSENVTDPNAQSILLKRIEVE